MINFQSKSDCSGCTACASICPQSAISMIPDQLGFLYPNVNEEKCTSCGLCNKVCAFNSEYDKSLNLPEPIAYGARHKDIREVETSRSGAAFTALSKWIIEQGGVVYGVGYKDHFRVAHKRAETREQCKEFKGSKYVQSDTTGIFTQVRNDLKSGKKVLFSGTPCQTAGLHLFVGKRLRPQLYLNDIICHGAPSPKLWKDYLQYIEHKIGSAVTQVDFRDKNRFGWKAHNESFIHENGKYTASRTFAEIFHADIAIRPSCTNCKFANLVRPSDLTIGDFWGWEKVAPQFNSDDKGVSLMLINTEKGKLWFEHCRNNLHTFPAALIDCIQPNLQRPSPKHAEFDQFAENYSRGGIRYAIRSYGKTGVERVALRLFRKARAIIKTTIKRSIGILRTTATALN